MCAIGASSAGAQTLRWGGDAEGGAPLSKQTQDPSKLVGFDVEIAELIARKLGRTPQFLQVQFTSLDQSAKRGDFDIGLSGIEDIPARRQSLAASIPYYKFREVLTVRDGSRGRYGSLANLKGKRVGTLGGADGLRPSARRGARTASPPFRPTMTCIRIPISFWVTLVVLDDLADRAMRRNSGLFTHPDALAVQRASSSPPKHRAARSGRPNSSRSHERRHARNDLSKVECLERRSAPPLRAGRESPRANHVNGGT